MSQNKRAGAAPVAAALRNHPEAAATAAATPSSPASAYAPSPAEMAVRLAEAGATPAATPAQAAAHFADGFADPVGPLAYLTEEELALAELRRPLPASHGSTITAVGPHLAVDLPLDTPPPGYILVVCGRPGFRRAGLLHPSRAEYPLDFFTQAQIETIQAEPLLTVVAVGGIMRPRLDAPHLAPGPVQIDPVLAGRAAADAVSSPPNRAEPGMRNQILAR